MRASHRRLPFEILYKTLLLITISLAGASAADDRLNLNRHWRNARTHSLHDPVRWKYIRAGEFALTGAISIDHGAL